MALFNKKNWDDGRTKPAQGSEDRSGARSEHPTEPISAERASPVPEVEADGADQIGGDQDAEGLTPPEPAEEPTITRLAAEDADLDLDLDLDVDVEVDAGTVEKDELRRAMAGQGASRAEPDAERAEDEARVSAEDLIAPVPKRKHPFQPDAFEERGTRRMKVYVMANQKGGVAKTTTTLNLAVALSESGHSVLCIDLDPQGNLTMSQGIDPDEVDRSMYNVLVDRMPISEVIQHTEIDIAVSSIDLAGAEIAMSTQIGRERSLQKALAEVGNDYDFVCIDTPPSLGLLTINALTAADKVIVPVQCEYLSMRGLVQLQNTLEMIRENLNPGVQIEGILPTMLDARTVHAKEAVEILEENFGELVFKSRIKKTIKFAEAPVKGSSVLKYDPDSNAAKYYRDLAEEVLTHGQAT